MIIDKTLTTPCGSKVTVSFNTKNGKTNLKALTVDSIGKISFIVQTGKELYKFSRLGL